MLHAGYISRSLLRSRSYNILLPRTGAYQKIFQDTCQPKMEQQSSSSSKSYSEMLYSHAAERNKDPILSVMKVYLGNTDPSKEDIHLLEISSGSGQHIVHLAAHFPNIHFHPSETDTACRNSIKAYIQKSKLKNIREPLNIDVCEPYTSWGPFGENSFSYVLNINMVHITKYECTESLFKNSQKILKPGGILFMYGPFSFNGIITPQSNVTFNESLKRMDPEFGLRDVEDLKKLGIKFGLNLVDTVSLPSNNHMLIWQKI